MDINFTSRSKLESLKKLNDGGEAIIYEYDDKTVIKAFRPDVDLAKKEEKVRYFISIKSQLPKNVIGPEGIVTVRGKFAGYVMRKLKDAEDIHMLTKPKYLTAAHLSNKDVLQIVTDIGTDLGKLHSKGILVGDVSSQNFQICGKLDYFIDVDSWGVEGKYSPDAYTELFTCPDSYSSNGTIKFSGDNENYNFAVLAFNILTRIHPFGGIYFHDKNASIAERMKKKISIIGVHKADIKIPKIIGSWKWMSPQLEKHFLEIFEKGKKTDITPDLEELLKNMTLCQTHDIYYYSKFNECPLCNDNAKIKPEAVVTKVTSGSKGPQIMIVFSSTDCAYILSNIHYLNTNKEIVHFATGKKVGLAKGKKIDFSYDGKIVYVTDDDKITIYNDDDNNQTFSDIISVIERMHKSNYIVKDRNVYYVDKGNNLVKLTVTQYGNMPTYMGTVYNPLFEVSEDGNVFVASIYPKKAIIRTQDYTFEVDYSGRINEYAIKYDKITKSWLFVYQLRNGKYRTMVFCKNKIQYDSNAIMYNAQPLSNIDFYNNTIYEPADGKIIGTNIFKNTAKEFDCSVVDESSRLEFTGRGFKIFGKNNIFNYG